MATSPFPPPPEPIPATPVAELDRLVAALAAKKADWPKVGIAERRKLLADMKLRLLDASQEWADLACRAKGRPTGGSEEGEEWLSGPVIAMRCLRMLDEGLRDVDTHGAPRVDPSRIHRRPDGRLVVDVFPLELSDKLLYAGMTGQVWMEPGVTAENLAETQAVHYRSPPPGGKVALVLGGGNMGCIPMIDSLYKLFAENEVALLKMNPVNEYLGPLFRRVFEPLIARGFFEVVYGGADVGAHLTAHPLVDSIHVTGSDKTYDAIVWGPPEGRAERKAKGERVNTKPITSELGNVTPLVVVPGKWTDAELAYQADHAATMFVNNASFNCNALKVIVTAQGWPQREAFLAAVRAAIAKFPARKAYYPGANDRWKRFCDAHPEAEHLVEGPEGTLPWTWIGGLDPEAKDDICYREEAFCSVLYETSLPGATAAEFLPRAVDFCNERLWGTLSCILLVDPRTRKDPASEAALQKALDDLRYGGITINAIPGLVFGLINTAWGAYPGHPPEDIRSGNGKSHNAFLFERAQKAVVEGPFVASPKPPWFTSHRNSLGVARRIVKMEAAPSLFKVPGIAIQALQG